MNLPTRQLYLIPLGFIAIRLYQLPLRILDSNKLRKMRFHNLRHTSASLLLLGGVDPRTIMENLAYFQISLTSDIFVYVLPELQRETAKIGLTIIC